MAVRRRYHFHFPGVVYVFITVLLAVGAFNSQNNLLFWAFGFALAILVVSGAISGAMLMGVTVEREPTAPAVAGEPVQIRYRVHNRNRLIPIFALHIEELRPPAARPPRRRRRRGRGEPSAPQASDWGGRLSPVRGFVAHVGPGQTVLCDAPGRALRRGVATLTRFRVQTTFPFGLVRKSVEFSQKRTILIRPRIEPPPDRRIVAAPQRQARGLTRPSVRTGDGTEFFALREYSPGDSLRTVAWKPSARLEKLHVRQNSALLPDRIWIGVHAPSGSEEQRAERALGLAAGLVDEAIRREIEVGLLIPAANVRIAPRAGAAQRERLMDELALAMLSSTAPDPVRVAERTVVVDAAPSGGGLWPAHALHVSAPGAAQGDAP
jgi:uncharacterized protein (DUF58 family)